MKIYKISTVFIFIMIVLSQFVSASSYVEMLKELDIRVLCILSWAAPLVALVLLGIGGILLITSDTPWKKNHAKSLIYNAILGLVLVFVFIFIAAYLGNLDLTRCLGDIGKPPEKPLYGTTTIIQKITTTSTIPCLKFEKNCGWCIKNGCEWCVQEKNCYSKDECSDRCVVEHGGSKYQGDCTQNTGICPAPETKTPPSSEAGGEGEGRGKEG